jgi:DNA-binding NarL/FixJ family response regulator
MPSRAPSSRPSSSVTASSSSWAPRGDAERAIELASEHQPDVAVLDWVMPGGGGEAAARATLQRSPDTKIVALTSPETRPADVATASAVGLAKGSPPDELLRAIRAAATGGD